MCKFASISNRSFPSVHYHKSALLKRTEMPDGFTGSLIARLLPKRNYKHAAHDHCGTENNSQSNALDIAQEYGR
jgi:hypothetical protein